MIHSIWKAFALSKGAPFQEVSAKTGVGVDDAFQKLIKLMLRVDTLGNSVNEDEEEVSNGKKKKGSEVDEDDEDEEESLKN